MTTMKVRIPAVISPSGEWCAYGYPSAETDPDWPMMMEVADDGEVGESTYRTVWITVDLPVPEAAEVVGEVEQ